MRIFWKSSCKRGSFLVSRDFESVLGLCPWRNSSRKRDLLNWRLLHLRLLLFAQAWMFHYTGEWHGANWRPETCTNHIAVWNHWKKAKKIRVVARDDNLLLAEAKTRWARKTSSSGDMGIVTPTVSYCCLVQFCSRLAHTLLRGRPFPETPKYSNFAQCPKEKSIAGKLSWGQVNTCSPPMSDPTTQKPNLQNFGFLSVFLGKYREWPPKPLFLEKSTENRVAI